MSRGTALALSCNCTRSPSAGRSPGRWGTRLASSISIIMAAKETTVNGLLIFSGALAMLIGLVAMIEGNLHCLGLLRRKKGRP